MRLVLGGSPDELKVLLEHLLKPVSVLHVTYRISATLRSSKGDVVPAAAQLVIHPAVAVLQVFGLILELSTAL